jgi:hypothetical protein
MFALQVRYSPTRYQDLLVIARCLPTMFQHLLTILSILPVYPWLPPLHRRWKCPCSLIKCSLYSFSFAQPQPHTQSQTTDKNAILLPQTTTLTFCANHIMNAPREPAIQQLTCEGVGCRLYQVKHMCCRILSAGANGEREDIEWSCSAADPHGFRLGSTDVSCEGFRYKDDPYVLKGSRGVTYRIIRRHAQVRSGLYQAQNELGISQIVQEPSHCVSSYPLGLPSLYSRTTISWGGNSNKRW